MQDSLSFRVRVRSLFVRLLVLGGFLLLMVGSTIFHYVKETAPMVKPFGALIFFLGVTVMSLGGIFHGGSMMRGSLISGREGRGWLLMLVSVATLIGSVLMIGGDFRNVFYENVPERHFLVTMSPDRGTIQIQFRTGWVYRSPFCRSYIVPQEGWNLQFCPEFGDDRGPRSRLLLDFSCDVNASEADRFAAAFAESFRQAQPGKRITDVLLGPVTNAYEASIKQGLGDRTFGDLDTLRQALEESLQRYYGEIGLNVTGVKLIPLRALQQPRPLQIGDPFA